MVSRVGGNVGESDLATSVDDEHTAELAAGPLEWVVSVPLDQDLDDLHEHVWRDVVTRIHLSQAEFPEKDTIRVNDDGEWHFVVVAEDLGLRGSPGAEQDDIHPRLLQALLLTAQLNDLPPAEGAAKVARKDQGNGPFLPEGTETFP